MGKVFFYYFDSNIHFACDENELLHPFIIQCSDQINVLIRGFWLSFTLSGPALLSSSGPLTLFFSFRPLPIPFFGASDSLFLFQTRSALFFGAYGSLLPFQAPLVSLLRGLWLSFTLSGHALLSSSGPLALFYSFRPRSAHFTGIKNIHALNNPRTTRQETNFIINKYGSQSKTHSNSQS